MENDKKWRIVEITEGNEHFYTFKNNETGEICQHRFVQIQRNFRDRYVTAMPDWNSAVFFDPEKDEVKGEGLFSTIFNYDGLVSFVQLKNGEFGFYYPDSNRLHDRTFKNAYYCLNNLALIEKDGKFHYYNLEDGHVFEGEFDHFLDASIEKLLNKHPEEYNHLPLALFMEALNNGNLQKYHNYIEDGLNELDSNCEPGDKAVFEAYKNLVHKMVEAKDRKAMQRWEEDKAAEEAEEAEMDE